MLLLTIRRAGDVHHLKLNLVESIKFPEGQNFVELRVAEHETAAAEKPFPVMCTTEELQQLQYLEHQTRLRAAKLQREENR